MATSTNLGLELPIATSTNKIREDFNNNMNIIDGRFSATYMAIQAANAVAITGGTLSGVTISSSSLTDITSLALTGPETITKTTTAATAFTGLTTTITTGLTHTGNVAGIRSYVTTDNTGDSIANIFALMSRASLTHASDVVTGTLTAYLAQVDMGSVSNSNAANAWGICVEFLETGTRAKIPVAFMRFTDYDYAGSAPVNYLFDLGATGNQFPTGTGKISYNGTLACRLNGVDTYLVTSSAEGTFTTAYPISAPSITGLTTPLAANLGGTGVANAAGETITIGGGFALTLTLTAATGVTLPTSGTLVNSTVATLSSLTSIGTITTGGLGTGAVIAGVTMTLGSDANFDMYYRASNILTRLAPNTAASNKFLRMIGTGTAGQAPSWEALGTGDIPDISATYSVLAGNTSLITLGTVTTGTWTATTIKANYLQNAAADLGAANIEVVLSNTNGAYVTNLTTDGTITATVGFAGNLTGNVTGNCSGTAATVTGAAQASITSLGTLTILAVDNIGIDTNTISSSSGAINLTPVAGSATVIDSHWSFDGLVMTAITNNNTTITAYAGKNITIESIAIDAGVITGATSITSTAFVGALTGNADTVTGFTLASGSLTLAGADALTLTTTAATDVTLPTTGTLVATASKLNVFAATTSAELAEVISDETGTDKLVYNTSPTFVTPTLGAANATSINLTGGQIAFPAAANPSAGANTLDDYEEGTWTMGVSFGGLAEGITYSINTGYYTKIGNLVTVSGLLILTSKGTSTGFALITGLPFAVVNNSAGYASAALRFKNITFANQLMGYVSINTTTIYLREITEAGVETNLTNADFVDNSEILVSCTYRA